MAAPGFDDASEFIAEGINPVDGRNTGKLIENVRNVS